MDDNKNRERFYTEIELGRVTVKRLLSHKETVDGAKKGMTCLLHMRCPCELSLFDDTQFSVKYHHKGDTIEFSSPYENNLNIIFNDRKVHLSIENPKRGFWGAMKRFHDVIDELSILSTQHIADYPRNPLITH